ncbi:hypothetical protein B0T14DRAFT_516143 [Immersiella caudata]|uniref:Uncharacterized protein n=1 Tax=Immersiella caudata TaxID=314043 RepID=A0AA39WXG2_9PEZI|nr:hypothetical protein B0T14DRAFT_516143 [Immersiella caudata]
MRVMERSSWRFFASFAFINAFSVLSPAWLVTGGGRSSLPFPRGKVDSVNTDCLLMLSSAPSVLETCLRTSARKGTPTHRPGVRFIPPLPVTTLPIPPPA